MKRLKRKRRKEKKDKYGEKKKRIDKSSCILQKALSSFIREETEK